MRDSKHPVREKLQQQLMQERWLHYLSLEVFLCLALKVPVFVCLPHQMLVLLMFRFTLAEFQFAPECVILSNGLLLQTKFNVSSGAAEKPGMLEDHSLFDVDDHAWSPPFFCRFEDDITWWICAF